MDEDLLMAIQIEISWTKISQAFPQELYQFYLEKLPMQLRNKNERFVRWQDRHAHLMGKILLLSSSIRLGLGPQSLHHLKYNEYGKPLLDYLNFSISHSGDFVVCASTTSQISLGIDIERKKEVQLSDFPNVMDLHQWQEKSPVFKRALDLFYSHWVIKESVIKAEGRGLSIPLRDIIISKNRAWVKGSTLTWHLMELSLELDYAMALAMDTEVPKKNITLNKFEIGTKLY